ncbi:MAG: DUF1624 domain-containing protein [Mucilaginibacter sp.]
MNPIVSTTRKRIESIDLLRGTIMIIMALDHTRDYFHADGFIFDPLDLHKTTAIIFLTRWITHFCAPIFMLLTGASAFIVGEKRGIKALSKFLLTRGLFLVILEMTVVNFAWNFNISFPDIDFLVIWSLGISMIALSAMVYLPKKAVLVIGLILVAGHNLLDTVHVPGKGLDAFLWSLLHEPGTFTWAGKNVTVLYPVISWIGTIAIGYSVGSLYSKNADASQRKKLLLRLGIGAILFFIVLRFTNVYGDLLPWSTQHSFAFTILSFINVTKYPPSLLYLSITLGVAFILLSRLEIKPGRFGRAIAIYGRVPMFYYLCHIYLIHLLGVFATNFCGKKWTDMIFDNFDNLEKFKGYGFSLGIVYLVWIMVILLLYPLCRWYDKYKTAHREKWWLSYL